jgi:chromosome segregation ATPase
MKLYELVGQYNELQAMIEDGEIDEQALADTLESIEGEIEVKADNIARLVKNLEAEEEAFKTEQDRLARKKQSISNKITSIKGYLFQQMTAIGKDKIKGTIFTVALQNNPPSLLVAEDAEIPMKYWKQIEPVVDKRLLLEDIKAGEQIEGVSLQQTKGLRIR